MLTFFLFALSVGPYVQLVTTDSISVVWWSENDTPGSLEWGLSENQLPPAKRVV